MQINLGRSDMNRDRTQFLRVSSTGRSIMVKRLGRTIVLLGMLNLFFLPETFAIPIVSVLPSSTIVGTGGSVTVDIDVSDVTDLYAFQFDIGFTAGILSATFLSEGGF